MWTFFEDFSYQFSAIHDKMVKWRKGDGCGCGGC